ncbi:hypothetical protein ACFRMN_12790 [Streptomyces sp. NPDC056835]
MPDDTGVIYSGANHGAHFPYPDLFLKHARLFLDGTSSSQQEQETQQE